MNILDFERMCVKKPLPMPWEQRWRFDLDDDSDSDTIVWKKYNPTLSVEREVNMRNYETLTVEFAKELRNLLYANGYTFNFIMKDEYKLRIDVNKSIYTLPFHVEVDIRVAFKNACPCDVANNVFESCIDYFNDKHREYVEYCDNDIRSTKNMYKKTTKESIKVVTAPTIQNVIFNPPATIVFWSDGSKTIVKAQDGEVFDPEKGMAMSIAKKYFGNAGSYFNQIKKWTNTYEEVRNKVKTIIDSINISDCVRKAIDHLSKCHNYTANKRTDV